MESPRALRIQLCPRETECVVCGVELTDCHQAVPVYEDQLLPDDHEGEWSGHDACERCHAHQGTLTSPVSLEEARRTVLHGHAETP